MADQSQGPGWWRANDGRWYPPQQAWSSPETWSQPKQGMNGCLKAALIGGGIALVLGVGCVALVGTAADRASRDIEKRRERARAEVVITDCRTGGAGWMEADVRVENASADRSNYIIQISFESPDGSEQIGTGTTFVNGLRTGQARTATVSSLQRASGEFACELLDVTRFSDEPTGR